MEIDPIVHEDYNNPNQLSNDIALLKLAESVDLNMYTPACMAAKDADYTGKNGRVYGKLSFPKPIFKAGAEAATWQDCVKLSRTITLKVLKSSRHIV